MEKNNPHQLEEEEALGMALPNQEYYFKSPNEMKLLFKDMPSSIRKYFGYS